VTSTTATDAGTAPDDGVPAGPRTPAGPPAAIAEDYGPRFWVGVVIGWSIIGFGIHSAYVTKGASRPVYSLKVLVLFALVHDLIVAPAVIGTGLALRRILRGGIIVRVAIGAAIVSIIVTAFAWGEIRGYGRSPSLQSLQLGNYATGLLTVLGTVWGAAAVIAAVRISMARRGLTLRTLTTGRSETGERGGPGSDVVGPAGLEQGEPPQGTLGSDRTDPAGT
jgi:hypothetical protein